MTVRNYDDLMAWRRAMDLTEAVYRVTKVFPKEEIYGLTCQIRRAAVSVPSNIAEGQGRQTTMDFLRFLAIAHGSLNELETQLVLAWRLKYLSDGGKSQLLDSVAEVARLLNGLQRSLRSRIDNSNDH